MIELNQDYYKVLYDELCRVSTETRDYEFGKLDSKSKIYLEYDLSQDQGKNFYQKLSDDQLLDVLRKRAEELDHSPAQKEVFWVWRNYIKERFQKWPYALEKAGLCKSAGARGKTLQRIQEEKKEYEKLLMKLRNEAEVLCRIPHPQDVPELCEQIKRYRKNWNDVITDAGFSREFFQNNAVFMIDNLEEEYKIALKYVKGISEKLGRAPLKTEIDGIVRKKLIERCGSWRNTLYQIDLEPIVKITPFASTNLYNREIYKHRNYRQKLRDCYYKVLNPDEQMMYDLKKLTEIQSALTRIPKRKEVPADIRKRLIAQCGSWENVLFQLN